MITRIVDLAKDIQQLSNPNGPKRVTYYPKFKALQHTCSVVAGKARMVLATSSRPILVDSPIILANVRPSLAAGNSKEERGKRVKGRGEGERERTKRKNKAGKKSRIPPVSPASPLFVQNVYENFPTSFYSACNLSTNTTFFLPRMHSSTLSTSLFRVLYFSFFLSFFLPIPSGKERTARTQGFIVTAPCVVVEYFW